MHHYRILSNFMSSMDRYEITDELEFMEKRVPKNNSTRLTKP